VFFLKAEESFHHDHYSSSFPSFRRGSAFYKRGYAVVDLSGPAAVVSYYEDGREDTPLYSEMLTGNG